MSRRGKDRRSNFKNSRRNNSMTSRRRSSSLVWMRTRWPKCSKNSNYMNSSNINTIKTGCLTNRSSTTKRATLCKKVSKYRVTRSEITSMMGMKCWEKRLRLCFNSRCRSMPSNCSS